MPHPENSAPSHAQDCESRAEFTYEALIAAYYNTRPVPEDPEQRVGFGTSGHRGSSLSGSFTESHILAISQAVCDYRKSQGISGPLFIGRDTHALSSPALNTALEVLAANHVEARIQKGDAPTPTPVVSHAVIRHNAGNSGGIADGIVITPSHNPPEYGGFKYNESHGGPAGTGATSWIEKRANEYLAADNRGVKRLAKPESSSCIRTMDFIRPYVEDLKNVINLKAIADSGLSLGAEPLGGAALSLWEPIAQTYDLSLTLVNSQLDPLFRFMPPDHDGKIRMDCSSPYAMAGIVALADKYDIAFGNDPDADRHGIVTKRGLMKPNQYLCAAVWYLLRNRPHWPKTAAVGKTVVTTSLLDKICALSGREIYETPVGFKWFVRGLSGASLLFGGEESAGASFLRSQGGPWSTDKDGIIMNLLAAEIMAVTGKDPADLYDEITGRLCESFYARIDAPASSREKKILKNLQPGAIARKELAGSPIEQILTQAPGDNEPIGGLKVVTQDGWFAARPSGTEELYKIYAESMVSPSHLKLLQHEAKELVTAAFAAG